MSTIWIKCPATGRNASTGIETSIESFSTLPDRFREVPCPACGMRHLWYKHDAWLISPTDMPVEFSG